MSTDEIINQWNMMASCADEISHHLQMANLTAFGDHRAYAEDIHKARDSIIAFSQTWFYQQLPVDVRRIISTFVKELADCYEYFDEDGYYWNYVILMKDF